MATVANTSTGLDDAVIRGTVKGAYRFAAQNKEPLWKKLGFNEMETDRPFEEFTTLTGLALARVKEQLSEIFTDVPRQNYTKRMNVVAYAIATGVSEELLRFIKRGTKPIRDACAPVELVSESMQLTNELLATDVFGNAFSTTLGLHPDGQPLCSATHKLGGGGTYSNTLGAVSMSQTSFEAAIIAANKAPSDRNIAAGCGDAHQVVCPEDLAFVADRILMSKDQSDTANRARNALFGRYSGIVANRYLPSTSNWFVVNTDVKYGLIALFETKPDIKDFGDDKVGAMWFRCYQMCAFDFFEPRSVYGSSV